MRGALHLLCTLVLLPYLLLAAWFLILGDAIAGGSLASFLTTLLSHALWLIPWGLIGFTAGIVPASSEPTVKVEMLRYRRHSSAQR